MSNFKNSIEELRNFDVSDISDFETIGIWPNSVKASLALLAFVACLAAGYFLHIQKLQQEFQIKISEESVLTAEFERKAFLAANLEEYREQTVEMEASFAELLRRLPSQTEVPGLVDDITDTGLGSGLEFSNIALSDEVTQEIYIELPIDIDVEGSYHDFGTFVSGVASLGRIVTLHDFSIVREGNALLNMQITAKTYRYKTEQDILIVSQ
jgi:type IV pilus assembly protein PilO